MLKLYTLVCLFSSSGVIVTLPALAQHDGVIRGRLQDTAARQPVGDATVTVLDTRESSLAAFSRSLPSGQFRIGGLNPGSYRLLITHVGYHPVSRNFVLTETVRDLDLGTLPLTDKSTQLAQVTVEGEAPPVTIRHDTVEFNAGSFKTKPDAVVEDLLKKLPGVQVDKNGTIKANGEEVKRVLVDGKEFFGNDPKIASKNLPADAVEKVQVFDKKSDQAQFTGFDDGNSQKTINLTIKKDRKNGLFGKATAGCGQDALDRDSRYEGKFNLNQFEGDHQVSALGMANNTNRQGFSFQDILGFNNGLSGSGTSGNNINFSDPLNSGIPLQDLLGNSQAITTTLAGGANFNDTWRHQTELNGNYFYNGTDDHIDQKDARRYLLPANSFTQDQANLTDRHNGNQRLTLISDQRIDSASSLKLSSSFIYQHSHSLSNSIDTSRSDSTNALLNNGSSRSWLYNNGYSWNNSALLRHRFAQKGRTLSATLSFGLNENQGGGSLYSVNRYYQASQPSQPPPASQPSQPSQPSSGVPDTLDQTYTLAGNGNNYGIKLSYTEPLSRRSLLEFNYSFYQTHSTAGKKTFDADQTGKYSLPDSSLTDDFQNTYTRHREGVQFRHQRKKFNFTVGADLQEVASHNRFHYLSGDSLLPQSFLHLLPTANLQFNFSNYQNLRVNYNTYTNQPSVTQLQPVPDNSDPLNILVGNPGLRPEYYHSLHMNYITYDPFRRTSFFAALNYNGIHDRIVNDDRFDSAGVRTTRPVNLEGLYRGNAYLAWEFPWRAIRSNLNVNSSLSYDHTASLVNGLRNNGNSWTVSQSADLNFLYKEIFDITGGIKLDYNDNRYSLQSIESANAHYWTTSYTLDFNWYLPNGFSIASDLDYLHRSGLPQGYNSSPLVWNAGLAKQLFPNKRGQVRLQVFDLLRQNTGFTRNTNQNYIDDISYKVLQQYWLLSFTYSIRRFAGKSIKGGRMDAGKVDVKIVK